MLCFGTCGLRGAAAHMLPGKQPYCLQQAGLGFCRVRPDSAAAQLISLSCFEMNRCRQLKKLLAWLTHAVDTAI